MGKGQDRVYDLGRAFRVRDTQSRQHRVAVLLQVVKTVLSNLTSYRLSFSLRYPAVLSLPV